MGQFSRAGTFRDRERFLEGFRAKIGRVRGKALQGMTETWETRDGADVARLAGFGAKIEFVIGADSWNCVAELPSWIPFPQKAIEEKFDKEFGDLSES